MQSDKVKQLLESAIAGCDVQVDINGSHFNLVVISDTFEGVRPLKRQQMVYAALSAQISDGSIHAVNMKTFTQAESDQQV